MIKLKIVFPTRFGLILILISALLYLAELLFPESFDNFSPGGFFIHYGITLTYLIAASKLAGGYRRLFKKETRPSYLLLLVLCNISAYSLNLSIPVFQESVDWLVVFLLVENIMLILLALSDNPTKSQSIVFTFFIAAALLFNLYQSFIVLPWTILGLVGCFLFGFSLLLFVPLFYVYGLISVLTSFTWTKGHHISFWSAILVVLLTLGHHVIQWKQIETKLTDGYLMLDAPGAPHHLPDWISVAQTIPDNSFMEDYLKVDLVYQRFDPFRDGFTNMAGLRFNATSKHDPLVSLSSVFVNNNLLDRKNKIMILNYLYDSRHESGERFWSGTNLTTDQVVTNVELFPTERLSFTEMILTITNNRAQSSWRNPQEAFYTFQLPEGGIVTSLSLWIEGEERKAILTSKKKAQKAYNTIVGKEMRDPSVVYWMEGNKIRVRVFPCTPQEKRKFKVGITAPLELHNNHLKYNSVTFKGPPSNRANAAVNVVANGAQITKSSLGFIRKASYLSWKGDYQKLWAMDLELEPFSTSAFQYKDQSFKTKPTEQVFRPYDPDIVFLDLNSHWTQHELLSVSKLIGARKVVTNTSTMSMSSHASLQSLAMNELPHFSLFPFYKINEWKNTDQHYLIITKSGRATPNLTDLSGARFEEELFHHFGVDKSLVHVIDIAATPSDYLRSLHELNAIHCTNTTMKELANYFSQGRFPTIQIDSSIVEVPLNGLSVVTSNEPLITEGSDHLMRLYYYQKVMKATGKNYFLNNQDSVVEQKIVDMAVRANIVTPLSSLIVLETQKDYDRFDIKKNKDALGNASINNSGAVPEPHEWALIIIGLIFLSYVYLMSPKKINGI